MYRGRQADLNFPELVTEYNSEVSGSVLKGILEVLFRVLTHSGGGMGAAVDGNKELDGACALERGKREKGTTHRSLLTLHQAENCRKHLRLQYRFVV